MPRHPTSQRSLHTALVVVERLVATWMLDLTILLLFHLLFLRLAARAELFWVLRAELFWVLWGLDLARCHRVRWRQ